MGCPLTPDALVYDLGPASEPQVSPDGRHIVYTVTTADRQSMTTSSQLWWLDVGGGDARRLTWSGEHNGQARWSPDGHQIAFVSDRVPSSGLFVLPAYGGEAREVTRHGQAIVEPSWSPDGARLAYVSQVDPENPDEVAPLPGAAPRVRATRRLDYKQDGRGYLNDTRRQLFVVDVASRTRRVVTTAPFDHANPQWSPDGRRLAAQRLTGNGMCSQLALVDVESGETWLVGDEAGVVELWAWSPVGDRLLLAAETRSIWHTDFFLYEVATGELRRLTDGLPCLPAGGYPGPILSQPVWLDERHALVNALRAGRSGLYTVDCESGAVELVQDWPARHVGLSLDSARRVIVQARTSVSTIGEIAITDRATGETRLVTDGGRRLFEETPPANCERFQVRRDPFDIDAWLLTPPDFDPARRYPLLLDVHGGPHNLYGEGFLPLAHCLATHGFLVAYANPRGSGSYGRAFVEQVIADWGGEDYRDLLAVVDALVARPYVDSARLGIYGFSYGGYMTAWAIGQTDRFAAAVCGAPVFDLASFYGASDIGHIFGALEFGGAPHERPEWYAARSPSTFAHRARTPTLILHGEADERCPIGQAEQMFVALAQAGCEVEFVRYPGGAHGFTGGGPPAHRVDYLARALAWFQRHLGEPTADSD